MPSVTRVDLRSLSAEHRALLDACVAEARPDFERLAAGMLSRGGALEGEQGVAWKLSAPCGRSPFVGELFWDCCRLRFVERLLEDGEAREFITDSWGLTRVIEAHLRARGDPSIVRFRCSPARLAGKVLRPLGRGVKAVAAALRSWLVCRPAPGAPPPGPLTLLSMFLLESNFAAGAFRDHYYPGLLDCLDEEERRRVWYLPEFVAGADAAGLFRKAAASGEPFLFKWRYLGWADVLGAALLPLRLRPSRVGPCRFREFDVTPLIRTEAYATAWNAMTMAGYFNYRFVARLRQSGAEVRLAVVWFENQLQDRGLTLGWHAFSPATKVVGYRGYIISPHWPVHMRPTTAEWEAGLVPERIAVIGRGLMREMQGACPKAEVVSAPALRYRDVWRPWARRPEGALTALVALPISLADSGRILGLLAEALASGACPPVRLRVKPHPATDPRALEPFIPPVRRGSFEFVSGDFGSWAEKSDVMVGMASGTCVEAVAKGLPVVVVANPRGLPDNPIPGAVSPEIWRLARTSAELGAALSALLSRAPARVELYQRTGAAVREEYFTPVDAPGVRRLLDLS